MRKQFYSISIFISLILAACTCFGFVSCLPDAPIEPEKKQEQEQEKEPEKQEKELSSIYISRNPEKLEYELGDLFDLSGIEVKAIYSDGSEKVITDYSCSLAQGSYLLSIGQKTITIEYKEKTASFEINVKDSEKPKEPQFDKADPFFWGTWVRMDNGKQYEVLESTVKQNKYSYNITASDNESLEVEGLGVFEIESDSVIICDNIPYFRKGGANLEYTLKLVGFTQAASSSQGSLSRAAGISDLSGIKGKGKSSKYKDFESNAESDSDGNIKFTAPTANDPQTVSISNGDNLVVIPGLTINNTGDYMGTVALVGKDDYNLKITGTISDDQKDGGYLFGNDAKEYEMVVTITNISANKCKSSICTIESDDPNLEIVSKDKDISTSQLINGFTVSTLVGGTTLEIKVGLKYGSIAEAYVNTGIKISIENPYTEQEWNDYIPLRFFKGLIPITVAGQSTQKNDQAALNGFIIYPDGNNQFFNVPNNSSQILFVPSFGKDKRYMMVFSGATVTSTLSDSTEMYYTVAPGTTKTRDVETLVDKATLREYLLFGGENHSEKDAYDTTEAFQAYLSEGEIDYYSILADSDEFYAPGAKNFYYVSYKSEHGTVPSGFYIKEDSTLTDEKLPDLEYPGMSFIGWYVGNTPVSNESYSVTSDIELTAKWNIADYPIEYELNGGLNASGNPATYRITDETIILKAPARDYYEFAGWYTTPEFKEDSLITQIESGTYGDIKLYAKWNPLTYKITFHTNEGVFPQTSLIGSDGKKYSVVLNETTGNYELEYNVLSEFDVPPVTRIHYGLTGWFLNEDGSGEPLEHIENMHGNFDLWAEWEEGKYRVSYYLYGGTNNAANPVNYTYNSDDIELKSPSRNGCLFEGWYTSSSFEEDTKLSVIASKSEGDIVLYAKWSIIEYAISYVLSGGTNASENPESYTVESPDITLKAPEKEAYKFEGWYTSSYLTGDAVTEIKTGTYRYITLYAKWTPVVYSITYNLNGGTNTINNPEEYTIESSQIMLKAPSRSGYKFEGWYTSSTFEEDTKLSVIAAKSKGDIVLYAKWSIINYSITYVLTGGTNNAENKASYTIEDSNFKLANPTFKKYEFEGWFENPDFTGNPVTSIRTSRLEDIILYAKWNIEMYTVTYHLNGGKNATGNPFSFTGESETLDIVAATRFGYDFDGWYKNENFSGSEVTNIPSDSEGNLVLWAKWIPTNYSITYTLVGGTNAEGNPTTYNIENSELILSRPQKDYYDFDGWYFDEDYSVSAIIEEVSGTDKVEFRNAYDDDEIGDVALYAKWVPSEYSITYNSNGGTNDVENPESFNIESSTITLKNASRFAYAFKGWYTTSTFTGDAVTSIPSGSHDDIVLYAKWEEIKTGAKITVAAPVYTEIENLSAPVVDTTAGTITFTASSGYSEYAWYADDSDTPLGTSETLVIDLSTTKLKGGYHLMALEVKDSAGRYYSAQYEFSFEK